MNMYYWKRSCKEKKVWSVYFRKHGMKGEAAMAEFIKLPVGIENFEKSAEMVFIMLIKPV